MLDYTDKRLHLPAGGRLDRLQVNCGVTALRKAPEPDAEMVSQALFGEVLRVHHEDGEFGLVQNERDGYVGWALLESVSAPVLPATHRVIVPRLHTYAAPNIRAAPHFVLGIGARLTATELRDGRYIKCERAGWIREDLLAPIDSYARDPAAEALKFLATPYLWGGRDCLGVDCSGLVQLAFGACGIAAPRDSDMQFAWFGKAVPSWRSKGALKRNDLVFWKGHVGIMLDADTLLHANANHMAVAYEPLDDAITRIAALYDQPIGARRVEDLAPDRAPPAWLTTR